MFIYWLCRLSRLGLAALVSARMRVDWLDRLSRAALVCARMRVGWLDWLGWVGLVSARTFVVWLDWAIRRSSLRSLTALGGSS